MIRWLLFVNSCRWFRNRNTTNTNNWCSTLWNVTLHSTLFSYSTCSIKCHHQNLLVLVEGHLLISTKSTEEINKFISKTTRRTKCSKYNDQPSLRVQKGRIGHIEIDDDEEFYKVKTKIKLIIFCTVSRFERIILFSSV